MKDNIREKETPRWVRIFSCVLFGAYAFIYIYAFQADALALTQHMLSCGQTQFNPPVGSCVITLLALGLQCLSQRLLPFGGGFYPLSFIPSAVFLVLLTAFTPSVSHGAIVAAAAALLAWVASYFLLARQRKQTSTPTPRLVLYNATVGCLVAVFFFIGLAGQTNDVWHYELRTARYLNEGKHDKALSVGERSLATSPVLTALRAFAMSHEPDGLGGHLFERPLPEGGAALLYLERGDTARMLFPPDSLYAYLGKAPQENEAPQRYFERVAKTHRKYAYRTSARDYWLCSLLLEKQLDRFARELPLFYEVSDSTDLPRYYAEALILYNRLRTKPVVLYSNAAVGANFRDFMEMEKLYTDPTVRRNKLWHTYGETYFWYYLYHPYQGTGKKE